MNLKNKARIVAASGRKGVTRVTIYGTYGQDSGHLTFCRVMSSGEARGGASFREAGNVLVSDLDGVYTGARFIITH